MKQSLDFPKPRLCPVTKVLYLYDIKVHYVSKDTLSGLQSQILLSGKTFCKIRN